MSDETINIVIDETVESEVITIEDVSGQTVVGPPGPKGDAGPAGTDGKSAYQIWLEQGNVGTPDDFIASLKSNPGDTSTVDLSAYALNSDLSTEMAARASADTNLQSQITANAAAIAGKQDALVSGANIKTINGSPILGSGDIVISGGGANVTLTDNLTTQTTGTALDAHQGFVLKGLVNDNATAINSEGTSRTNADNNLQSQITTNATNIATKEDKVIAINLQSASYTAQLSDANKLVRMNLSSAGTFTIPPNSSVAFAVGAQLLVSQSGAGQITITAGAGVIINSAGGALKTRVQYSTVTLIKTVSPDTWLLSGDITT